MVENIFSQACLPPVYPPQQSVHIFCLFVIYGLFPDSWVWELFIYVGSRCYLDYMVCKPFCTFFFFLHLAASFIEHKFEILMKPSLSICLFMGVHLASCPITLPYHRLWISFPTFSSKSFIVFLFTPASRILFNFCIQCEVWVKGHFFA